MLNNHVRNVCFVWYMLRWTQDSLFCPIRPTSCLWPHFLQWPWRFIFKVMGQNFILSDTQIYAHATSTLLPLTSFLTVTLTNHELMIKVTVKKDFKNVVVPIFARDLDGPWSRSLVNMFLLLCATQIHVHGDRKLCRLGPTSCLWPHFFTATLMGDGQGHGLKLFLWSSATQVCGQIACKYYILLIINPKIVIWARKSKWGFGKRKQEKRILSKQLHRCF